jgi:hypothetical protein
METIKKIWGFKLFVNKFFYSCFSITIFLILLLATANFSRCQPTINVSKPSKGEVWYTGNFYEIKWDCQNINSRKVKISLKVDDKSYLIAEGVYTNQTNNVYTYSVPKDIINKSIAKECKIIVSSLPSLNQGSVEGASKNYFTIITPIKVDRPNGGELWVRGQTYKISWNCKIFLKNVNIELSQNSHGKHWFTVKENAINECIDHNNSNYYYTVPMNLPTGNAYKIHIVSLDKTVQDSSDNYFSVVNPMVLLSPNGGEIWNRNKEHIIKWNCDYQIGDVKILLLQLSPNGQNKYYSITQQPSYFGSFNWNLPQDLPTIGYKYKIVIMNSDGLIKDESDDYFSLINPAIIVNKPNGGEVWGPTMEFPIEWSSKDFYDNVDVLLIRRTEFGEILEYPQLQNIPNSGRFVFRVPSNLPSGFANKYKICVRSLDRSIHDESDQYFTIYNPPSKFNLVKIDPNDSELGDIESEEIQGIANSYAFWYICNRGTIYKSTSANCTNKIGSVNLKDLLNDLGNQAYDHFGDMDFYDGLLYVATTGNADPIVVVFDENLNFKTYAKFPIDKQKSAAWVAIDPITKNLFSSDPYTKLNAFDRSFASDPSFPAGSTLKYLYSVNLSFIDNFDNEVEVLKAHNKTRRVILENGILKITPSVSINYFDHVFNQGGAFSPNGNFYYVLDDATFDYSEHSGIHAFRINGNQAREFKINGKNNKKEIVDFMNVKNSTRYLGWRDWEFEGITVWDRGGEGQIHVLLMCNEIDDDDISLLHYWINNDY